MKQNLQNYVFILLLFLVNYSNEENVNPDIFKGRENILRKLTMKSLTKVTNNFYMINYLNDYYLDDLLKFGHKNINSLINFIKGKIGNNYDFNINKITKGFACSSFNVYNNNNQNLFGRNFDYSSAPTFIVWTQPKKGYKSISFVHGKFVGLYEGREIIKDRLLLTAYAPMDGMNEHGLAISVLLLDNKSTHQSNPTLINVSTSIMIRGVLDFCKNINEAILFFKKFNMHDAIEGKSFHFMLTDSNGDSVIIEYIDNEIKLIKPNMNNYLKYLYITNFYLSKDNFVKDNRYKILEDNLKTNIKMEWNQAMDLLNKVKKNTTVWSNIYNTANLSVITAYRIKYSSLYEFNVLNPMKIK